jgi:hypothetical protein
MKTAPFDSTPEFQHFTDVMRKLIQVPKAEVDAMVKEAHDSSPRKGNPKAPGRKRKAPRRTKTKRQS